VCRADAECWRQVPGVEARTAEQLLELESAADEGHGKPLLLISNQKMHIH